MHLVTGSGTTFEFPVQAMVLTDCRDQLDSYGIDTALKYLEGKLTENAIKRLLGENTMFNEVRCSHADGQRFRPEVLLLCILWQPV